MQAQILHEVAPVFNLMVYRHSGLKGQGYTL
jgi:hypothetical protein